MQTLYAIVQLRSNVQLENGKLHYNHDLEAKLFQVVNTVDTKCDALCRTHSKPKSVASIGCPGAS